MKGYFNIEEVEYAILETNGQISVIPKDNSQPVSKSDLNMILTKPCSILISQGIINHDNLKLVNKDEEWLLNKLKPPI